MISQHELLARLSTSFDDFPISAFPESILPEYKPAAVLIPILNASRDPDLPDWHLLFTRRTDQVADHKGQVSFPGGSSDPEDSSPSATALREAYEEIGLKPQDVLVIGKLNQLPTITHYLVTPVIGLIPWPYTFTLEPEEVSLVFTIPLDWLANPANHEVRQIESILEGSSPSRDVIVFKPYHEEILWGVSAEITIRLIQTLFG